MSEKNNFENVEAVDQEEILDEATEAASSLKPGGSSKSQMLGDLMRVVGAMKKDDLSAFLTKTLDQVGKEDETVADTSARNKASIAMKGAAAPKPAAAPTAAMKEDMDDLLGQQEDLSEDFKVKATTLFEAAVNNRVELEVARLEEEFETKLEEQVSESITELHAQVDQYMDYVVEKWMEENALAIETGYRTEITESFIEGLKNLFAESYIEVPEEKLDILGEMQTRLEELEESLESVQAENIKLNNMIEEAHIEASFEDIAEGLADTQVEKLRSLSEGIEYSSHEEYTEKLKIIKNQYFSESSSESNSGLINEENSVGSNEHYDEPTAIPDEMKSYVQAISKTIRK